MNAILAITSLSVLFGLCLSVAAKYFRVDSDPVIDHIEALLPQTQCAQCNYPGCRPYAEAIASGEASINQCPPGGTDLIHALAELLGRDAIPLNPENGMETPIHHVRIVEADCIGCTLCIQACPVDAILGASQQMHTVIESECTGCDLCLPPCPVDCIEVVTQCTPEQGSQAAWP